MAVLQTQTFDQVVENQAIAIQGNAKSLIDFSPGSILLALVQASSSVAMWLQGLLLQLLATTRAATSVKGDLDSWMADYGLSRLPAVQATGTVTFARFTPTTAAIIPVGMLVQTTDGSQQYQVIADTAQSAFNGIVYALPAGVASASVTVQALHAGTAANIGAGVINALSQPISGIDTVSNAAAFATGVDAESDAALRVRFVDYLASLSKATKDAIGYAIGALQEGLTYTMTEDYDYSGAYDPGYFYVVVDDGSGAPPSNTLTDVANAIDATRACGIRFGVFPPIPVSANVSASVTTSAGYVHATVAASVQAAISAYITNLAMGTGLAWSRLYQVAYDASPGVSEVTGLTLNGAMVDLAATPQQAIIPGAIVVA